MFEYALCMCVDIVLSIVKCLSYIHIFSSMEEEDFIPDYGPYEDEIEEKSVNHVRGSTLNFKKGRKCTSCEGRFTCVRRHVLRTHLPWYISPNTSCWVCKLQFGQTCLLNGHIKQFHNSVSEGCTFTESKYEHWVELINGFYQQSVQNFHAPQLRNCLK